MLYSRSGSPRSSTAVDSTGAEEVFGVAEGAPEELSIFSVEDASAAILQVAGDGSGSFHDV